MDNMTFFNQLESPDLFVILFFFFFLWALAGSLNDNEPQQKVYAMLSQFHSSVHSLLYDALQFSVYIIIMFVMIIGHDIFAVILFVLGPADPNIFDMSCFIPNVIVLPRVIPVIKEQSRMIRHEPGRHQPA